MTNQSYWSPLVRELVPYTPGEQPKVANLIKLNTNENPYPPSPLALNAMQEAVNESLRLYPDPDASALKQAIANYYGVEHSQVFVGNGSDEVLAHAFMSFFKQNQPILFPDISYSFYKVYAGLYEVEYQTIALNEQFQINVADYHANNGGIIFPNPNAPTGCVLPLADIEKLLQANTHSVVIVDEAYIDFGGQSAISLVNQYPQLLVTQTLSKSRSLAGLRVGLAIGQAHLIEALERVKNSFNSYPMDKVAIAGGVAAFEDKAYFAQTCQAIIESREQLATQLSNLGFEVLPSAANFVFVRHPQHDAATIALALRQKAIIVRHFKLPRIEQFLRITVGKPSENDALIKALTLIL
jgi:histidinol-phosphate aminotransferase